MIHKKIVILIVALVGITTSGILIIRKKNNTKNSKPYKTEKPTYLNLAQHITASGTLKAKDQIIIGSLVAGKIEKINVDRNDVIKRGQVLAVIDNGIGDSAVKRLNATLQEARATWDYQQKFYVRQTKLYKAGQLARNQYEFYTQNYLAAQANVAATEAALEQETKIYENLFIKSPDDGVIISKNIEIGQAITAQLQATILFIIAKDLKQLEAYVDVDEADIGLVKKGQIATFRVDAFPKQRYISKVKLVEYLAKFVDNITTYATILDVENNDLTLRPGMTVNVDIKVLESSRALSVPNKALRINRLKLEEYAKKKDLAIQKLPEDLFKRGSENPTQEYLWIVDNAAIKQIAVNLGTNDGKYTEVKSGISEQTDVITELIEQSNSSSLLAGMFGGGGIGR